MGDQIGTAAAETGRRAHGQAGRAGRQLGTATRGLQAVSRIAGGDGSAGPNCVSVLKRHNCNELLALVVHQGTELPPCCPCRCPVLPFPVLPGVCSLCGCRVC